MNIKDAVSKSTCCGCCGCVSACPTNAIKMKYDEDDWHLHPDVDESKCIHCKKCIAICPAANEKPSTDFTPYGYAAVASDEVRMESSSGGIFPLVAEHIISKGGYVAGAVFDDTLTLRHVVTNNREELIKMQGSKYVQSDASSVYTEIKNLLNNKKTVLFCGTPCQVSALKNIAGNNQKNLFCIDILCHGTPSPKVFDYYLKENFDKTKIKNVIFRNKRHRNGHPGSLTVVMKDGKEFYSEYFDNSYYNAFLQDMSQRSSCFDCKFAEFPRTGDLSLGDFWGAKAVATKIDHENGCSVVIINNKKGAGLYSAIRKKLKNVEEYSTTELMAWNRNKRFLTPKKRKDELVSEIKKYNSLRTACTNILENKYEVGIFGTTMNPNFGGLITYYSLYEAVKALGYSTVLIHRPVFSDLDKKVTHANEFFNKHCNTTGPCSRAQLKDLNNLADKFVLGSDQVWNHKLFSCWDMSLYFDFVNDEKSKIAYAASFGHNYHDISAAKKGQASKNLKKFDFIAVRESDGVNILSNEYGISSTHVMDPVFLVDTEKYRSLANQSSIDTSNKFVGSYIIEPNNFKLGVVKRVTDHLKIGNINTTDGNRDYFNSKSQWFKDRDMHIQAEATIYDWLKIIIESEIVVTDSYHATCFCIMFNKPFILLQERWALSRIESIMNLFSLHERWVQDTDLETFKLNDNWFMPLDASINEKLRSAVSESYQWLATALKSSKQIHKTAAFTPYLNHRRVEDYFYFLLQNRKDYVLFVSSSSIDKKILSSIDFKCKLSFEDFITEKSSSFAMLYDFGNDYFAAENSDYIELSYKDNDKDIICIVDKTEEKTNTIFVNGRQREFSELSNDAGVVISIYSKSQGRLVDSFNVILENNTAIISR